MCSRLCTRCHAFLKGLPRTSTPPPCGPSFSAHVPLLPCPLGHPDPALGERGAGGAQTRRPGHAPALVPPCAVGGPWPELAAPARAFLSPAGTWGRGGCGGQAQRVPDSGGPRKEGNGGAGQGLGVSVSSALPSQVNKEEEADENETEWLMEEVQVPAPRPGKEGQENGHITTKSVKADALTSLHGDDQDSEDEVLTIPEVRVHSARGTGADSAQPMRHPQRKVLREPGDARVGLARGERGGRPTPRPVPPRPASSGGLVSFHDDSDEDLLNI